MLGYGGGMDVGDVGSGDHGALPGGRPAEESHACPDTGNR